jgi:hypothetical protein
MQVWVEYEGEKVVVVEEFHKRWVVLHGQKKKITCLRNAYNNMVKESGIGFHYWLVKVNQLFSFFLIFSICLLKNGYLITSLNYVI